ncbi:hypothetical protein M8494_26815 [Serratia ureilytica]
MFLPTAYRFWCRWRCVWRQGADRPGAFLLGGIKLPPTTVIVSSLAADLASAEKPASPCPTPQRR